LEKRRTWRSYLLVSTVGMGLSLVLLLAGQALVRMLWPDLAPADHAWPYLLVAIEGLFLGLLLGRLSNTYPGIEGFQSSLVVAVSLLVRDGFSLNLDNVVEILLMFEAHFAALYMAAFVVFLIRGGGLAWPMFVGLRYLRFKMITGISVIGVALGVAALMVVLSVMSGFEMDLKGKIIGTNAHAILQKRGIEFVEYQGVLDKLRKMPGVVAATPFVYNEVMVTSEYNLAGVFIRGIDPKTANSVTKVTMDEGGLDLLSDTDKIDAYLEERLLRSLPGGGIIEHLGPAEGDRPARPVGEGDDGPREELLDDVVTGRGTVAPADDADAGEVPMPGVLRPADVKAGGPPGIFIGKELKKILRVGVGDRINVVSPLSEELGPSGPVPRARTFRVAGVFYTGMYEYDAKSVYVTLPDAQKFFGMGDTVTGLALRFDNLDRATTRAASVLKRLDGYPYFTRTWLQMNKNLFSALKLEKVGMFIILIIVILVSAFGIISTLIMLVWEKIKEIAILKSMGATGDGIMKIFMIEGLTIGMVGTLLGVLVGWLTCLWVSSHGIQLDPEVYYIEKMPVNMDPVEFVLIAGIALHISFIATIYPARRASRLRPVEGLRYD